MATQRPVYYDVTLGHTKTITAPDTIDPAVLPVVASTTQRTFAFFTG